MNKHLPIHDWSPDDRPREKMQRLGHKSLTNSELLAILLGSGTPNESAVKLAQRILAHYDNNLGQLSKSSVENLCEFHGVGLTKATRLTAAFELVRRHKQSPQERVQLNSSQSVYDFLQPHLGNLQHEEFWVIYLNQQHTILSHEQLSRGGITQTSVDIRLAFKRALDLHAVAMILAHNHPSGNTSPNVSDQSLTKQFVKAGKNLDIKLLDHLIITENTYFSFADEGLLYMILIYTHQLNARIRYVFTHFFETYTDNTIEITDVLETFIAHNGPKFSYTNQKLSNEFFVHANPLLFEQGVREQEIKISRWQTTPVFFPCNEESAIPYDIFAATFYMLSRYEEHIPHLKDDMNRFSTSGSLASAAKFANKPIVDIWAQQFLACFKDEFPELMIKQPKPNLQTILEVPVAYAYKSKSVLRTFFESVIDFFNLRFLEIFERFAVRLSFRPDPYDIYKSWVGLHQKFKIPTKVMFMFARPSANDRNISIFKHRFIERIKDVADNVPTSLLASYQSTDQPDLLQIEVSRLSEIIHHPLKDIRQHLVRLRFPTTYDQFANLGFTNDYSLQFVDFLGYRAGTGFPFRFYNLSKEQCSNLLIHPVVAHETILRDQRSPRKARRLLEQCKAYNKVYGTPLTLVLTNTILDHRQKNKPWKRMFTEFLENYDQ